MIFSTVGVNLPTTMTGAPLAIGAARSPVPALPVRPARSNKRDASESIAAIKTTTCRIDKPLVTHIRDYDSVVIQLNLRPGANLVEIFDLCIEGSNTLRELLQISQKINTLLLSRLV